MSTTTALRNAGRTPPIDVSLPLSDGTSLTITRWLRVLPGKRLVAQGEWDGQAVLAKLFIATGAERHWQRESNGIHALQRAGITSPALLGSGELPGGGYYLLTEYLDESKTLQQLWDELANPSPKSQDAQSVLTAALQVIASMHRNGLAQVDLHLGNFLQQESRLYVIDGDAIEAKTPGQSLSSVTAEANLAVFFAQFTPEWDELVCTLLESYQRINPLPDLEVQRLGKVIAGVRQQRLDSFLHKTLRDCSQFAVRQNMTRFVVALRSELEQLTPLINDPDAAFNNGPLLKDGGSSTVARMQIGDREIVVKRYNIKGIGHWLQRFWRPSRAWHSWLAAWRLEFLGIATPKPLAMIEDRIGPFRRQAWLISEYCPASNIIDRLGESGEREPDPQAAQALLEVFGQLTAARISHGDCKGTNLLWHDGRIVLIDLDAMQHHRHARTWRRAWSKDRRRFIRNWPEQSVLAKWLRSRMPD